MAIEPDYYQVLGVAPDASREEIKAIYRRAVRAHHPDAAPVEQKGAAHAKIQLIIAAWTVLGDVSARAAYDEKRRRASVEEARLRAEADSEPRARASSRASSQAGEASPSARGAVEDVRKKSRVQAVMGAGQAPRSANPRTKLLAMVFDAAQLYHVEGRPDEAARVCQSVLRADPTNAEAAVLLADIYISQSKRSAALDLLERALRLQPANALYRSKWEALRHSAPPSPSASNASSSSARAAGPNPWSRVPEASPLASRISLRPDAATDDAAADDPFPTAPSGNDEPTVAPDTQTSDPIVPTISDSPGGLDVHKEAKPPEPRGPAEASSPAQRKATNDDPIKRSFLQRLRSKLSS